MVKAQSDYEIEKRETALTMEKKEKAIKALELESRNKTIWFLVAGVVCWVRCWGYMYAVSG